MKNAKIGTQKALTELHSNLGAILPTTYSSYLLVNFNDTVKGASLAGMKMARDFKALYKITDLEDLLATVKGFVAIMQESDRVSNTRQFKNYTAFLNNGSKSIANFFALITDNNFLQLDMKRQIECSSILGVALKEKTDLNLDRINGEENKVLTVKGYADLLKNAEITLDAEILESRVEKASHISDEELEIIQDTLPEGMELDKAIENFTEAKVNTVLAENVESVKLASDEELEALAARKEIVLAKIDKMFNTEKLIAGLEKLAQEA